MTPLQHLRVKQIKLAARALNAAETLPGGGLLLRRLAKWPLTAPVLNGILGYHRLFDNLAEAVAAAAPYADKGHNNPGATSLHMSLSLAPRPSDYAALFHIQRLLPGCSRVFDLGGNMGNLFYCYDRYLHFPQSLTWQVYELPDVISLGQKFALERNEKRLHFTQNWMDASGAGLLLASGSLHYFEGIDQMVAKLKDKPLHVLINRSPLIEGPTKATVQDGGHWRVGCILYNRAQLIAAFEAIGYELIDQWKAAELSLILPGQPEFSAAPYSGLYFRLKPQA